MLPQTCGGDCCACHRFVLLECFRSVACCCKGGDEWSAQGWEQSCTWCHAERAIIVQQKLMGFSVEPQLLLLLLHHTKQTVASRHVLKDMCML